MKTRLGLELLFYPRHQLRARSTENKGDVAMESTGLTRENGDSGGFPGNCSGEKTATTASRDMAIAGVILNGLAGYDPEDAEQAACDQFFLATEIRKEREKGRAACILCDGTGKRRVTWAGRDEVRVCCECDGTGLAQPGGAA